jgi:heat shock protein HspQ
MPLGVRFFGNESDSHTARVRRRRQQQVAKYTSWPAGARRNFEKTQQGTRPQTVSSVTRFADRQSRSSGINNKTGGDAMLKTQAKYHLGQVLRHRKHPFRGVVFDVDAMFSNTEDWYDAIPEDSRPRRDQPFYHLLAENDQSYYVAYVSEQNLVPDETGEPVDHPDLHDLFGDFEDGRYPLQFQLN